MWILCTHVTDNTLSLIFMCIVFMCGFNRPIRFDIRRCSAFIVVSLLESMMGSCSDTTKQWVERRGAPNTWNLNHCSACDQSLVYSICAVLIKLQYQLNVQLRHAHKLLVLPSGKINAR